MAHKCPKNICYSLSKSADIRMASAVCNTNDGDGYVLNVENIMNVSPGKNNEVYSVRRDKLRFARSARAKLPSSKVRRNILKQDREVLRKKTEQKEGITYQSNCGLEIDANPNYIIRSQDDLELIQKISITPDTAIAVYFDLETSGFGYSSDILQIAATSEGRTFSLYVTPTQAIHEQAGRITGLKNIAGQLYHNGQKVNSIPIEDALQAFLQYLNLMSKPCLLIAHNATFDSSHLLLAAHKCDKTLEFGKIIAGFSDTYPILKKIYPDRKGAGMFQLERLATDLLNVDAAGQFHEAVYDVEILERIVSHCIPKEVLFQNSKRFMERLTHCLNLRTIASITSTLSPLTSTLTRGMIKKIAEAGITFENLKELEKERGIEGLLHYLSEKKSNGQSRVTRTKKVLTQIATFFNRNQ